MKVRILLIRHAKPMPPTQKIASTLSISSDGIEIQRQMNLFLQSISIVPDVIWHSPIARTKETAQIIADFFNVSTESVEGLSFSSDIETVSAKIHRECENQTLFIVSHGPVLHQLASTWTKNSVPNVNFSYSSALLLLMEKNKETTVTTYLDYFDSETLFNSS